LGIQSLFSAAPTLYLSFKIAGGCYLIYLGLKQFKRKAPIVPGTLDDSQQRCSALMAAAFWAT